MNKYCAENQWGQSQLGDRRRNIRAVKMATCLLNNPAESLPAQMTEWKNLKGAYRLLKSEKSTHETLQEQHWQNVRKSAQKSSKTILFIQDKSELDYSSKRGTDGLGPIGNHKGKGIVLQSVLAVECDTNPTSILGLAYQKAWIRTEASLRKKEKRYDHTPEAKKPFILGPLFCYTKSKGSACAKTLA